MATVEHSYGTRTQFSNDTNLHSLANNAAEGIGKIDNSTTKALDYILEINFTLSGTPATNGYFEVYVVVSGDDSVSSYTDGIDPTSGTDFASSVKNSSIIAIISANATNQVVKCRTILSDVLGSMPKYMGIFLLNKCGVSTSSSGGSAYYTPVKLTVA